MRKTLAVPWALAAMLVLGVVVLPRSSSAEPRAKIVLVVPDDALESVARRLRAELEQLGLDVVDLRAPAAAPIHRSLEDAARSAGAFAAVRIESSAARIEVWIADRVTGKIVLREIVLGSGESAEEVVAVRAVELLRASLVELELPQPVRGDVPARPEVEALVPEPERERPAPPRRHEHSLQLELGPATALGPGGLEARPALRVAAAVRLWSELGAEMFAQLPVGAARIDGNEGSAEVRLFIAGAAVRHEWRPDRDWVLSAGAGLAVVYFRMEGSAQSGFDDRSAELATALPHLVSRLQYSLGGRAWVGVDVRAGLAIPRPVVRFAGREAATWGRPALLLSLPVALDVG